MPRIPDRWLDYSFSGKPIADTPFIALKCPLHDSFFHEIPSEKRFSPNDVKTNLPSVSMIIDLTFTYKYYDRKAFDNLGIEYRKVPCIGHLTPGIDVIRRFFRAVDEFLQNRRNDGDLIGVHCTHGVNRTGFFICSYMISKLGFTFENAVKEFNQARGHNIERQNYLNQLQRYEEKPLSFIYCKDDIDLNEGHNSDRRTKERTKPRHRYRNRFNGVNAERNEFTHNFSHNRGRSNNGFNFEFNESGSRPNFSYNCRPMNSEFHSGKYRENFHPFVSPISHEKSAPNFHYYDYYSRKNDYSNRMRNCNPNPVPPYRNGFPNKHGYSRSHVPNEYS